MKKRNLLGTLLLALIFSTNIFAALPQRILVGYWENWNGNFVKLRDIDSRYNVVCLAFAETNGGSVNGIGFNMYSGINYYDTDLISDIALLRSQGKTVLMSFGGANGSFKLATDNDKTSFVTKVKYLVDHYGVDGIDIDLEQATYVGSTGTIGTPGTSQMNLILAMQELLGWYQTTYGKKMILTMAPETTYYTGGMSSWAVTNVNGGDYLPIVDALYDDIDLMMVQLYNSGSMLGLDGSSYNQGTADFIVSQTEAVIKGFNAPGLGTMAGFPANKVIVALPSCSGNGSVSTGVAKQAMEYLMGYGAKPGSYILQKAGGYPTLRGMMTWDINADMNYCSSSYAQNFKTIYDHFVGIEEVSESNFSVYPNPAQHTITIDGLNKGARMQIYNMVGDLIVEHLLIEGVNTVGIEQLAAGIYSINIAGKVQKLVVD